MFSRLQNLKNKQKTAWVSSAKLRMAGVWGLASAGYPTGKGQPFDTVKRILTKREEETSIGYVVTA